MELYGVKIKENNYFTLPRLDRFIKKFGSMVTDDDTQEQRMEVSGSLEDFIVYLEEEFNIATKMEVKDFATHMLTSIRPMREIPPEDKEKIINRIKSWRSPFVEERD